METAEKKDTHTPCAITTLGQARRTFITTEIPAGGDITIHLSREQRLLVAVSRSYTICHTSGNLMRPLLAVVHRHPLLVNVVAYGTLFSAADVAQQVLSRPNRPQLGHDALDLRQTAKVALVGFIFHANFNYVWFRSLEHFLPGTNASKVMAKVVCDQTIAAPITIGAFYTGLSLLDGDHDIFEMLREKFWPSYKAGVLCWTLFQAVNFTLVPPMLRTAYVGACSFLWTTFLCFLRKSDTP